VARGDGSAATGEARSKVFGNPFCTDPEARCRSFTRAPEPERSTRVFNVIGRGRAARASPSRTRQRRQDSPLQHLRDPGRDARHDGDASPTSSRPPRRCGATSRMQSRAWCPTTDKWIALFVSGGFDHHGLPPDRRSRPERASGQVLPVRVLLVHDRRRKGRGGGAGDARACRRSPPVKAWWKTSSAAAGRPGRASGTSSTTLCRRRAPSSP